MYSKSNPYFAFIKERYDLCKPGSHKNVFHVVLDLQGSGMTYQVGDSLAVFADNDPELIENTLRAMKSKGNEVILEKHTGQPISLREFLTKKGDATQISRKLISEIALKQTDPQKKQRLESLLIEEHREVLKEYQATHEIWDALEENPEVEFTPQELSHLMQPLLPRFYSIASSMEQVGEEVHLTVAELQYMTNGHLRRGICTHYLCALAPLNQKVVPIYVQPHHGFTLPADPDASIIMIGPGTGVAPFRAFMQEREVKKSKGKNWLFFGECYQAHNFFYEDYWAMLEKGNRLRIETAFSRDQENKIYVQHRLLEHGAELFEWMQQGAYVYVCGDAHRMAKDVDLVLHQVVQKYGKMDESAAKQYVKEMRTTKRYLRDVY